MNLDEWENLLKNVIGPTEFRAIALEFLHEHYRVPVHDADGKGDSGVDAWVILTAEPATRVPAQFYAGKTKSWDQKLREDVKKFHTRREALPSADVRRLEFRRLLFVCTQEPDAKHAESILLEVHEQYGISVQIFDARAIASTALRTQQRLLALLADRLPARPRDLERPPETTRDRALLSFAFFHPKPAKYRWEVAKSVLTAVLQRSGRNMPRERLLADAAAALHLSTPPLLLERALRNLQYEQLVMFDGDEVVLDPAFAARTATALKIAAADEATLRERCIATLDPFLAKGVHHRGERARRAVDAIFGDLGLLVRISVADRTVNVLDLGDSTHVKHDDDTLDRWRSVQRRLELELDVNPSTLRHAFEALVCTIADSPFARSLAAAELFLKLTEYDAGDLATALGSSAPLRVALDASIAMPMFCALYSRPVPDWEPSSAAHTLHGSLRSRGAKLLVPSVYVEEIAVNLQKAWAFHNVIDTQPELERSRNFIVAHYCSLYKDARRSGEFLEFLEACGAQRPAAEQWRQKDQRKQVELELKKIFDLYGIEVVDVDVRAEDRKLLDEPARDDVLLRHDRAVVRWLTQDEPKATLCTADRWLQGVLGKFERIALDSAALVDLLELLHPTSTSSRLHTPLAIAQTLGEEHRVLAASVWDELVAIEGLRLDDWKLRKRAKEFHAQWVAQHADTSALAAAWLAFRDAAD